MRICLFQRIFFLLENKSKKDVEESSEDSFDENEGSESSELSEDEERFQNKSKDQLISALKVLKYQLNEKKNEIKKLENILSAFRGSC